MLRSALLIGLFLSIAHDAFADDKRRRNRGNQNSDDAAAEGDSATPDVPDDDNSRTFSELLMEHPYRGFRPNNQLRYTEMLFAGDNTWTAQGEQRLQGSATLPCTETGSWTMEAATTDDTAVVQWVVVNTDCLGRSGGSETRVQMTIDGDVNYTVRRR